MGSNLSSSNWHESSLLSVFLPWPFAHRPGPVPSSYKHYDTLQIQTLRLALLLRAKDTLTRRPEVRHLHSHTTLPQRHHTCLRADGFDVSSREIILLRDELLEIYIVVEIHLGCVEGEDL